MGMSTHVIGLRSNNDPTYLKHVKVLIACIDAEIKELPKETADYFGSPYPDKYLIDEVLRIEIPKYAYRDDMLEGYEVIVKEIPVGVAVIRFYNSY